VRQLHEQGPAATEQEDAFEMDAPDSRGVIEGLQVYGRLGLRGHASQGTKLRAG
jgi:hypothetical protein